jgi:hypothetical protein
LLGKQSSPSCMRAKKPVKSIERKSRLLWFLECKRLLKTVDKSNKVRACFLLVAVSFKQRHPLSV